MELLGELPNFAATEIKLLQLGEMHFLVVGFVDYGLDNKNLHLFD